MGGGFCAGTSAARPSGELTPIIALFRDKLQRLLHETVNALAEYRPEKADHAP